ncbi:MULTISPECIES: CaiB/BaiF CoA transferase family protein [Salinibaculum]|uniref:CaiB/BaiF CoA transferase family protein n=1 Tax=Salinibaculum TaxID=2732368 RepID=UPI0030D3C388
MDETLFDQLRVLDFSQAGPGPLTGVLFADFGADVISVEPPGGATTRTLTSGALRPNYMRNKRSLVLNLKAEDSEQVVRSLVESADVLIHNNRPGTMERLGCDYETLRAYNDELVYCSLTGYGESGPYSDRPCFDPHAQAMSGLMWNTGEPDRKPSRVGASLVSFAAAQAAAFGIMGALWNRERTGEGQKVEASLFDTAGSAMGYWYSYHELTGTEPTRRGHSWDGYCPAGVFDTADEPVYLAIPSQRLWKRFCSAIDREEWVDHPKYGSDEDRLANREELFAAIEEEFAPYDRAELMELLSGKGVPVSEVQTIPEAANDDHLRERGTVREVPDIDGDVTGSMPAVKPARTPPTIEHGPPEVGEHTAEILTDVGFDTDDIVQFDEDGVVSDAMRK